MKNFLRIAIVIILLVGVGFGAYSIFFKPANDEAVFLALSEINSEEEKETFKEMYKGIGFKLKADNTIINPQTGSAITLSENYAKVLNEYREKIGADKSGEGSKKITVETEETIVKLEDGKVKRTDDGKPLEEELKIYTYPYLKSVMDKAFDYYVAYSQAVTKNVDKSELNDIKKLVENYKTAFSDLESKFKSIESLMLSISTTEGGEDLSVELKKRFQNTVISYRSFVYSYAELTEKAGAFVREYVFDDAVVIDKKAVTYELFAKYIKTVTQGSYSYSAVDDAGLLAKHNSDTRNAMAKGLITYVNSGTIQISSNLKYIAPGTVTYGAKVFESRVFYFVPKLEVKVKNGKAYFGDSESELPASSVTTSKITFLGTEIQVNNNLAEISNLVFEVVDNKVYAQFNGSFSTSEPKVIDNVVLNSKQIVFGTDTKYSVEYFAINNGYILDGKLYALNNSNQICKVSDSGEITDEVLSGAEYNEYIYVESIPKGSNPSISGMSDIDYDLFINAYENVFSLDREHIDSIINMSLSKLSELKEGNVDIVSTFPESIQSDVRIIAAAILGKQEV